MQEIKDALVFVSMSSRKSLGKKQFPPVPISLCQNASLVVPDGCIHLCVSYIPQEQGRSLSNMGMGGDDGWVKVNFSKIKKIKFSKNRKVSMTRNENWFVIAENKKARQRYTMPGDSKIKINKFDGHDFGFSKLQIEDYLQALGAVRLSLAKNVAYNVVNEKTTYGLFKALSNMLISVDIKFDDEVQALLLLSLLPESWSGTVTIVGDSTGTTKIKFNNIRDLIIGEDILRKTAGEYLNSLLSAEDEGRGRKQDRGQKARPRAEAEQREYGCGSYYEFWCIVPCYLLQRRAIKVQATLRYIPGLKMRLISVGQLDKEGYYVGFGYQKWKVTKGSLVVACGNKCGSLYMVEVTSDGINAAIDGRGNTALWHQRFRHIIEKGMKILASKGRIPDLQKAVRLELVHTDVYGPTSVASIGESYYYVPFINDSSGKAWVYFLKNKYEVFNTFKKWKAAVENETKLQVKCLKSDNEEWQGKEVSPAHLKVFGCDSYVKEKDVARDKIDAKAMKDVTFNEDSLYGGKGAIDSSNLTKLNQKDQVVLEDSPKNLANKSIVAENWLSSETTKSLGGSSDMSEGSENSRSFEDSGRSDEEDSEDRAFSKEGGSETSQVRRSTRESRAPVRYSLSANYLLLTENGEPESYLEAFYYRLERRHYRACGCSGLKKRRMAGKAYEDLHLEQLDIKTAFLHGDLDEDIYMTQLKGFQSGSDMAEIKKLKRKLSQEFEMKDLGSAKQILGMSIINDKTNGTLSLSQEKYIGKVLEKFNMKDAESRCQPLGDHFKLVGSVMYAMVCTRLDIAHAVGVVSRFIKKEVVIEGFSDSDYQGCLDSGKSTTSYVFTVGGTAVRWMSRIQKYVAMSTTKAEYMAIAKAGKELSAIHLAKNLVFHGQTKHIKIRYHYIREPVSEGTLSLEKILRAKNLADMLTKVVTTKKLKLCAASTSL
ncbi:retrovirus-related pol polyprotein from transposon TNT 1-94 [Tanacetum coccineum]